MPPVAVFVLGVFLLGGCAPAGDDPGENDGINISRFAFRDSNRNGRFDLGERPYAGLVVELAQSGRDPIRRTSNIAGFANFRLALGNAEREISAAGELAFTAIAPDGFRITTPEPTATTVAFAQPESPGGLFIDPLLPLVGVAPVLTLSGNAGPGATVAFVAPDGSAHETQAGEDGRFAMPAAGGTWLIDWTPGDGMA
ncbi:MAG: hypothetical protein WAT70_03340, partial [Rhizobiaceae bacterium]